MNELAVIGHPLLPANVGKNTSDRLEPYLDWLRETRQGWLSPNMQAYADYLQSSGLADSSIAAHIHTIRGRYRALMKSNNFREMLFDAAAAEAETFVEKKALVDEKVLRLDNALREVDLTTTVKQDREAHVHLSEGQVNDFLTQLAIRRDVAMFKLMLGTGLRAAEVAALEVADLHQVYQGEDCVEVRHGKGDKQRMVPWGKFRAWCMPAINEWMTFANISEGALFRGLLKNGKPRPTAIKSGSINFVLESFPITHAGKPYTITPHDCRYTYARWAYLAGMTVPAIQKNLGHKDAATTWIYIGDVNIKDRAPTFTYT